MKHFKQNTKSEHNSKLKKILQKMPTFYSNDAKSDFSQRDKSFQDNHKQNEQTDLQSIVGANKQKKYQNIIKTNNQTPKVLKQFGMFKRSLKQLNTEKNKQNRRRNYSQKYFHKDIQTKSLGRSKNNKVQDIKRKIQLDKQKHAKKYRILQNMGYSQDQIYRMKSEDLNQKLSQFIKNKGLQYLRQDKQKKQQLIRRTKTQQIDHLQTIKQKLPLRKIVEAKNGRNKQQQTQRQFQIINKYLPQIYEELRLRRKQAGKKSQSNKSLNLLDQVKRTKSNKSIKYLDQVKKSINYLEQKHRNQKFIQNQDNYLIQRSVSRKIMPLKNHKKQNLTLIKRKEDILGKIVFDKVKTHLKIKQKPNYFERVKSEQNVDGALIQFLKMKINRAEITLK